MAKGDKAGAEWRKALERSTARTRAFMLSLVAELDTEEGRIQTTQNNLIRAANIERQLTEALAASGYSKDVRGLYSNIATLLEGEIEASGEELRPLAETLLTAFSRDTVRELDGAWFKVTGAIRQAVEGAVLTSAPIGDLIAVLAGEDQRETIRITADLRAPMRQWVNWASAAVETLTAALVRRINTTAATLAGVELFVYSGSEIRTTRPFCSLMRNVVLTLEELQSIETDPEHRDLRRLRNGGGNGQPDIVTTLGGFRCRHDLVPISRRRATDRGLRLFSEISDDLNRRAARAG